MAEILSTYQQLLRDPKWQKRRLEILERDHYRCRDCLCSTRNLQVHHLKYVPGMKPWEYDAIDLLTLCDRCHGIRTDMARLGNTAGAAYRPEKVTVSRPKFKTKEQWDEFNAKCGGL